MAADNPEATLSSQYTEAFAANLMLSPQQSDARLVGAVDADTNFTLKGESFNADYIDPSDPEIIEDRFGPSPAKTLGRTRRVGFFNPYDDGNFLDDVDQAKSLSDAANPTVEAMRAGLQRHRDDVILGAMFGSAYEGRHGTTTVAFPAAQTIAIDNWDYYDSDLASAPTGNAGLTVSKLIKAKTVLAKSEIAGQRFIYASAEQIGNLLRDKSIRNINYNEVKALVNGEIDNFMGFTFIRGERAPLVSNVRSVPAWVKPAIKYRGRNLQDVKISQRADRKYNWYAYYKVFDGASRSLDAGLVQILCSET